MFALRKLQASRIFRLKNVFEGKQFSSDVGGPIDSPEPPVWVIPRPPSRDNESQQQMKARLTYQSRKRGMLENDLLLSTFIAKFMEKFTLEQLKTYDRLINEPSNDWDIYYWATNIKSAPEQYQSDVLELLKEHVKNINKELRIKQPNLV